MRSPLALLALGLALVGCATTSRHHALPGVPVESRPSPPPPPPDSVAMPTEPVASQPPPPPPPPPQLSTPRPPAVDHAVAEPETLPPVAVGSVMTPDERRAALARIVADTTATGVAVRKCGSRALLPDQESVLETTRSLLDQARAALERDELWRAESLARKARQLASSLECPG